MLCGLFEISAGLKEKNRMIWQEGQRTYDESNVCHTPRAGAETGAHTADSE